MKCMFLHIDNYKSHIFDILEKYNYPYEQIMTNH